MSSGGRLRNRRSPSTTVVIFSMADQAVRERAFAAAFCMRFSPSTPASLAICSMTSKLTRWYQVSMSFICANAAICVR